MRIACITSSYPSVENAVAGSFVARHVELLEQAGHEVTVFTWRPGTYRGEVVVVAPLGQRSMFAESGAPDALERAWWRAAEAPVAVGAMVHELGKHRSFDLYIGHWMVPGGLVARIAADRARRPSLVVGHSAGVHMLSAMPPLVRDGLRRHIVRPGSTTVPSEALAAKLGGPARVLPMGFDPPGVVGEGRGVLLFGRLVPIKGFDVALSALSGTGAELHVVGDGPERERLRQLAPDAKFWGWADEALKREAFAHCDRALFPSRTHARHEGWPVSVMEVASCGIVPFMSPWPGADEMSVDPRQLVEDGSWAAVPQFALQDLQRAAQQHALRYTWSALEKQWTELVEKVAHQSP